MNASGTFSTAMLRGLYVALAAGFASALPVFATTDQWKPIVLAFAGAFLGALGFRGVAEGTIDSARQKAGDVQPSDVQVGTQGQA